jgi:hypothetical protein
MKISHATLPWEHVGKIEGKYIHEYDNFTTARPMHKFKDTLFPKYFDTFEELVASCDERDLWSTEPTTEAFINLIKHTQDSLDEFVVEEGMDEEDIEAIPEDVRMTREDIEAFKRGSERVFAEMRQKGVKKWHEEMQQGKDPS